MPRLTPKEIGLFQNDFKIIATSCYKLSSVSASLSDLGVSKINHEEETLRCLSEMYGAEVAETARMQIQTNQGDVNMSEYGHRLVQNVMNIGVEQGRLQNAREATLRMWEAKVPVSQIATFLGVSAELVEQWIHEEEALRADD